MENKSKAYKVRMLLLWIYDKRLGIYNTARFTEDADRLLLAPVWEKLEAYVRPRITRYSHDSSYGASNKATYSSRNSSRALALSSTIVDTRTP